MKVSGFTIVRNAVKYNYPVVESIKSILPICDEFIVNVGDSEDETLSLIRSLNSPKVRMIQRRWDMSRRPEVLSIETNQALKECKGDWAFYLQSDEMIHEDDLPKLKKCMTRYWQDASVDALRFRWLHFYGSFWRYRIDAGWYQKQDRIIRNNGKIESCGDAFSFRRVDGKPLRSKASGCFLYHYGWVQPGEVMRQRRRNAESIGFVKLDAQEKEESYSFGDLNRFPAYFGSHPKVMKEYIAGHALSSEDEKTINRKYWFHPAKILKLRFKTSKRIKEKISD
ncbi:MAG TPA: glycosyltransferase [Candidatus Omnitrophota bacterium]|nr:glycosyltransferase [Candidatus Omnitrophota bacterium]HPD84134.1 glycosyltransferase [Candidatus Omnitrophota bacterium]HRZ02991.1 glycosyltransferase [Candidatus Omnitrophota bacterium]